jgi:hypothetical protein
MSFVPNHALPTPAAEQHRQHVSSLGASAGYRVNVYGNIGAPVLPPIKVPESNNNSVLSFRSEHPGPVGPPPAAETQPKQEDKPVGGVAQTLDYEMEQMIDFVAQMSQGMYELLVSGFCLADIDLSGSVQPSLAVTSRFRSFVSQILTSTRLPSSTILLALNYLSTRMTMLSSEGFRAATNGDVRQMLTTSLMLASKFLDDNTFQNRSWAEVSNIAVTKLNSEELGWLDAIGWDLHIDPLDHQGFDGWLTQWGKWKTKKLETTMDSLKLTPLDAGLRHQHIWKHAPPTPIYTPTYQESMYGMGLKDRSPAHWNQWPATRNLSPLSAPHTGPNTPEWYARNGSVAYTGQTSYAIPNPLAPVAMLPPLRTVPSQSPFYNAYGQPYSSNPWGMHNSSCMCGYCSSTSQDRCQPTYQWGAQPVFG